MSLMTIQLNFHYLNLPVPTVYMRSLALLGFIMATLIFGVGCQQCAICPEGDEWLSLFNGKDLTGWIVKCKPADADKQFWQVEDGTILADSMAVKEHDYIWLLTEQQYGDFILRLRFQAYRDNPGNSGIQIRSRYDDQAGWTAPRSISTRPVPGEPVWSGTRQGVSSTSFIPMFRRANGSIRQWRRREWCFITAMKDPAGTSSKSKLLVPWSPPA